MASVVGKDLEEFNKDPIDSVQYIIGMEKRKNGREIAEKVYDHYFVKNKNKETHQQFSEVKPFKSLCNMTRNSFFVFLARVGLWIFQMRRRICRFIELL